MSEAVAGALEAKRHCVVEAGTGVGKSFAYLVPHILRAAATGTRAVVATHTILLQEQLTGKDLPALQALLPVPFSFALAKGRSNYACGARLRYAVEHARQLFGAPETDELQRLHHWYLESESGDRSTLDFIPSDDVWDRIQCEGTCRRKAEEGWWCGYARARAQFAKAQILVANHALLAVDLTLRAEKAALLPDYAAIVVDEAHALERSFQQYLGAEVSREGGRRLLNEILGERGRGASARFDDPELRQAVQEAKDGESLFFDELRAWVGRQKRTSDESGVARVRQPDLFHAVQRRALETVAGRLMRVQDESKSDEERAELARLSAKCDGRAELLGLLVRQGLPDAVYWVESSSKGRRNVKLQGVPIDPAPEIRSLLFDAGPPVTLTSATLTTGERDFAYFKTRVGLEGPVELAVGSPFDFARQARVVVARGIPEPGGKDQAAWLDAVARKTLLYLRLSRGRAFVLFTSFGTMREIHRRVLPEFPEHAILVQGEGLPRRKMIERMKAAPGTVIFGVDSFWQGVDVPGEALENVIITKLPFPNPTEPMVEARMERMDARGEGSFGNFMMPEAIIKLRQGFGRLIRTATDKGVVAILDSRVARKAYGRHFLAAIPECPLEYDDDP